MARRNRTQFVMNSSEIAAVYANWPARVAATETTKPCGTCGLATPDGTCPDCDPEATAEDFYFDEDVCGTCGLLTPDGTCPDCAKETPEEPPFAVQQAAVDREEAATYPAMRTGMAFWRASENEW